MFTLPNPSHLDGVIEGFYGNRWSVQDTGHVLGFMAQHGLNAFIYAPKNDPYQRSQWYEPYPSAALNYLVQVVGDAARDRVDFIYSVSPGLSIQYHNATDEQRLLAKIDQVRTLGVNTFMLSFDDIPGTPTASLAADQAALANAVMQQEKAKDPAFRLLFTPTLYSGVAANSYWSTLHQALDPSIAVVWTGPEVLSPAITPQQVAQVTALMGHQLVIWDNYPVNDYTFVQAPHQPRVLMGPVIGRSAALPGMVAGYFFNPMLSARASEVALWTGANYLTNPAQYNPETSWTTAIQAIGGPAANSFSLFCQDAVGSPLDGWSSSFPLIQQLQTINWNDPHSINAAALQAEFTAMEGVNSSLAGNLPDHALYLEIEPWTTRMSLEGRAGLLALQVLNGQGSTSQLAQMAQTLSGSSDVLDSSQAVSQFISHVLAAHS